MQLKKLMAALLSTSLILGPVLIAASVESAADTPIKVAAKKKSSKKDGEPKDKEGNQSG
jgi:hypothetical protein